MKILNNTHKLQVKVTSPEEWIRPLENSPTQDCRSTSSPNSALLFENHASESLYLSVSLYKDKHIKHKQDILRQKNKKNYLQGLLHLASVIEKNEEIYIFLFIYNTINSVAQNFSFSFVFWLWIIISYWGNTFLYSYSL